MVTKGRPGRPFGDDLRRNYRAASARELAGAAAQAAQLGKIDSTTDLALTELAIRLANRRAQAAVSTEGSQPTARRKTAPSSSKPLAQLIDSAGKTHAALEELLVRTSDYNGGPDTFRVKSLRQLVTNYGLNAEVVDGLEEVTSLSREGVDAARLATIAALLRNHGYPASVNQIVPLGYVTKAIFGQVGAEPADPGPAFPAPDRKLTRRKVTVAVIDTGVDGRPRTDKWLDNVARHGDRNSVDYNIDPLYEFNNALQMQRAAAESGVTPELDTYLDFGAGHGQFVAGVVAQVAPFAQIRVYRAIDGDGVGSDVDVARALLRAVADGARIINLSLGTETPDDQPPLATQVALEMIAERSEPNDPVIIVAAAGNNGSKRPVFPAAFSRMPGPLGQVIAVAGLTMNYEQAAWSSRGYWVDCSTGAEGVLSTFVQGTETEDMDTDPDTWDQENPWAVWTGTSFAAPQVSGALARRYQSQATETLQESLNWLLSQGRSVPDYGKALEILPVGSGSGADTTTGA